MRCTREPPQVTAPARAVEVRELTHVYRGQVTALREISMTWPPGIVALLGANGAGKTTLLRVVTGALRPTSGSLAFADESGCGRRRVGYLPQDAGWPGQFTVLEFLTYLAWARGVRRSTRRAQVDAAIAAVDLTAQCGVRLGRLSGGQRRRAMLAQALLDDPALLVLDEPTAGFDPAQRVAFRELIGRLAPGRTVVISTHLVEDVELLADWVTVLREGEVSYDGPTVDLVGPTRHAATSPLETALLRMVR
jgi:ABC-2 type transport system ATP-binding protein